MAGTKGTGMRRTTTTSEARGTGFRLLVGLLLLAAPAGAAEATPESLDLAGALARAAQENPRVRAARERVLEARTRVRAARADKIPDLDLLDSHLRTNRTFPAFFRQPKYQHQISATLKQRIFSAGALSAGVRLAHAIVDEAEAAYHQTLEEILERVTIAFLQALQADETQKVLEESIATHQRRIADIDAKVEAGVLLETDRLQADLQLLEDERNLLVSRTTEELARDTLDVLLSLPNRAHPALEAVLEPLAGIDPGAAAEQVALERAPTLNQVEARVEQARSRVRIARAAYRPTVDVQVTQNHVANGLSVFSADATWTEAVGVVGLPIFDGGRRDAELDEARRSEAASRLEARAVRDELTIQLGQAALGIEEAQARLDASTTRIRLATRNREIVQERFLRGAAIQAELLDADVAFRRAKLDAITSRFDILRNVTQVLRLTGQLTGTALAGRPEISDPFLRERLTGETSPAKE